MLTDLEIYGDPATADKAVYDAKELFGQHRPYETVQTLSGGVIVFNKHFTDEAVDSFLTNCMVKLSKEEGDLLLQFIDWQNFLLADPQNPIVAGSPEDTYVSATDEKDVLIAFNNWLVDELAGTPHPEIC